MATITVKNIPDDLYEELKNTAYIHRRSINNEVIHCIENAIKSIKIDPNEFIFRIENFHKSSKMPFLTDDMLKEYKESGRK